VAFVGGLPLTRTTAASRDDLTSWIESDGRWLAFPSQTRLWRRSKQPIDLREDGGAGRWHAGPASDGNVRCRVENDGGVANAGFYVSVGRMAEIDSITVEAESVRSDRDGDTAQLTLALYFDVSGEGEYLAWEQILGWDELKRNTERWTGFGGDVEGVAFGAPADEQVTVDDETELTHFPPDETVTFGDYRDGKGGVEPDTDVALQVGVWGGGADTVEEAVVEAVTVERS
jgi:hypothetical protein